MKNRDTHKESSYTVYTAHDIAQILVRNPDELSDLLTYDFICEAHGKGRAFEDMPLAERKAMLSVQAAMQELKWLGFDQNQIDIFVDALKKGMQETGFNTVIPEIGIPTIKERFEIAAFCIMTFPYGPPLVPSTPDYPLKSKGLSIAQSGSLLGCLTNRVTSLIFTERESNPYLLCVPYSPESPKVLAEPALEPPTHN